MDQHVTCVGSILDNLRRETSSHRWYIPEKALYQAISKETIEKALRDAGIKEYQIEETVEHVMTDGVKIFAVLVLINQVPLTSRFIEEGQFHDQKLPFSHDTLKKHLSLPFAKSFYERQWELTAPVIRRGTIHKSLESSFILPFLRDQPIGKGAFGTVYEIEIDDEHQELEKLSRGKLVRKELEDIDDHAVELENLATLGYLKHPNILELLASYTYVNKHNLITPLAEGGTLADLFTVDRSSTPFRTDASILVALAGLSSAVGHVHSFVEHRINLHLIGCHHDLRPKNILVSGDTLILADFGLARFKKESESSGTIFRQGGGDYRAPECEDIDDSLFTKFVVRRSSDIWSFGCVIAETAAYMALGPHEVKAFRMKRRFPKGKAFYHLFHCGRDEPNVAVSNLLSKLASHSSGSYRQLAGLVEKMLCMDHKKRPQAGEVTATLRRIALSEVAGTVDKLLTTSASNRSIDFLIEKKRFDAWRYAIGLLDRSNLPEVSTYLDQRQDSQFLSILEFLHKMRAEIKSTLNMTERLPMSALLQLSRLNDCLYDMLDSNLQLKSVFYFRASVLEIEDCEVIEQIQSSGEASLIDKEIRMRVTLKQMTRLAMELSQRDTYKRQLEEDAVNIGRAFGYHNLGLIQEGERSRQMLVEWRNYGRHFADESTNNEVFVRVEAITELLCQEKPEEFCALDCRGFYHDSRQFRFGIVFDFPSTSSDASGNPFPSPKTLHDLIEEAQGYINHFPSLDDRFRLAQTLARSVLEFHLVGWLHRALSSSNVIFFDTAGPRLEQLLQQPYIIGFSHSRPDEISAFTTGPTEISANRYHHPSYLEDNRRYCPEFDYYSFGILLLEIGLWSTLDNMSRKYKGSGKYKLLKIRIPLLKQHMGRRYCEAARVCLESDFGEPCAGSWIDKSNASLHLSFERLVVDQLGGVSLDKL